MGWCAQLCKIFLRFYFTTKSVLKKNSVLDLTRGGLRLGRYASEPARILYFIQNKSQYLLLSKKAIGSPCKISWPV